MNSKIWMAKFGQLKNMHQNVGLQNVVIENSCGNIQTPSMSGPHAGTFVQLRLWSFIENPIIFLILLGVVRSIG